MNRRRLCKSHPDKQDQCEKVQLIGDEHFEAFFNKDIGSGMSFAKASGIENSEQLDSNIK